ncbi:MAG: HD domain-containing protein [Candidatus Omnitrophica bacterium]|nr:HD domain-containing protein [Candidatus Omnitrophota bacterium]
MEHDVVLDFFAEAGKLKQIKRSGWWMTGVPEAESVADHSFRCAVIGYVLAKIERVDAAKVLMMTLFNDLHEARINDLHKVAHRYLNVRAAEKKAFKEQITRMSDEIKGELAGVRREHDTQKTAESIVARDADILECLIQAKEYADQGFQCAKKFFKKAPEHLKTKSAKKLWKSAETWDSNSWWEKISEFER